jgi:predicted CopG family antitoxin
MKKVIKVDEGNYKRLLAMIHTLEMKKNQRQSFDDVISLLIKEHEKLAKDK